MQRETNYTLFLQLQCYHFYVELAVVWVRMVLERDLLGWQDVQMPRILCLCKENLIKSLKKYVRRFLPSSLILSNSFPKRSSSSVTTWLKGVVSSNGFHRVIASVASFFWSVDSKSASDAEWPDDPTSEWVLNKFLIIFYHISVIFNFSHLLIPEVSLKYRLWLTFVITCCGLSVVSNSCWPRVCWISTISSSLSTKGSG